MTIESFIQNDVLLPRLSKAGVLVVYDPERRYRPLCLALAGLKRRIVDASESSIESREAAQAALLLMGQPNPPVEHLLIYVPAREPLSDEDKLRDPFAAYGEVGAVFPASDGDRYQSLCERAKLDHLADIRRIFENDPAPSFAVIDAVGDGAGWAQLRGLLHADSARDILHALLAPTQAQQDALAGQDAWAAEAKALLQNTLGLTLMTRAKKWPAVSDELWRFVLFSEFIYDLPSAAPEALAQVPRCRKEALSIINDLCERLRNDQRTQARYIEQAEAAEAALNLPATCADIADLGVLDTFPFEERTFFAQAAGALKAGDDDRLRALLARHAHSIWVGRGENQAQWRLLQSAADLVQACDDGERQLAEASRSQGALLDAYVSTLHHADRLQRELEQAAALELDAGAALHDVLELARKRYRHLADAEQRAFIQHLDKAGWPAQGQLANADVFDRFVAPALQESGRRVALFLVDALRYELGAQLHKQLVNEGPAELQAACAQLPTVTPVGMASLLPGAGQGLAIERKDNKPLPMLDGQSLTTVQQRLDILRQRYGQRFADVTLNDFGKKTYAAPAGVELLVIRSNEMDSDFENNPEAAPGLISRMFQKVRAAVHKLRGLGFQDAIIVTDHGFFLNAAIEAGDVCAKPVGTWVAVHERMLLGDGAGASDAGNIVLSAGAVGIRGDFRQAAQPRAMVAYQANAVYFHGGASLQETVVPVIALRLRALETAAARPPTVTVSYRRAGKRITTRLPVVEVAADGGDLFSAGAAVEVMIEAQDRSGAVVGEAQPGGAVNPATRTLQLQAGQSAQVTLKMDMNYEGKFTVKALDPATLTTLGKLDLETDYTV